MPTVYILVFCEPGCEAAVVDDLITSKNLRLFFMIYIILKVTSGTTSKLDEIIRNNMRNPKS
jgi:hypothetical protein